MKLKATFPKRRDGSYGSVTVLVNNKPVALPIDANGEVDVPDDQAASLLLTKNFTSDAVIAPDTMLITNGEEVIDLLLMEKAELLAMAEEMGLGMNGRSSANTLREAIKASLG